MDSQLNDYEIKLRDQFALAALNGFFTISHENWPGDDIICRRCYEIADKMLAERGERYDR